MLWGYRQRAMGIAVGIAVGILAACYGDSCGDTQLQMQLQMGACTRVLEAGEYVDRVGGYGMRESVCADTGSGRPNLSISGHL